MSQLGVAACKQQPVFARGGRKGKPTDAGWEGGTITPNVIKS
jgi:hypothetical protein